MISDDEENPVDKKIIEKSLKVLKSIVNGNNYDHGRIEVIDFKGAVLRTDARTSLTLTPQITQKTVPGKDLASTNVDNQQGLKKAVDKCTQLSTQDAGTQNLIQKLILNKEGQGFGLKNQKQKFHELKKSFTYHTPCQQCHANGKIPCPNCHANGRINCPKCHASGSTRCFTCNGAGQISGQNGHHTCPQCHGQRQTTCISCNGARQIPCRTCGGNGATKCNTCAATGWMSHTSAVEIEGTFMFHVNPNNFPHTLVQKIEKDGTSMLKKNDLIVKPYELSPEELSKLKPSQIAIGYKLSIPYGELVFKLDQSEYNATLIGYEGRLENCPNFLEHRIGKYLSLMVKAAKAPSNKTYPLLEKALNVRFTKELVQITAKYSPKKAFKKLKSIYPYGIQDKTLKTMINATRKSFLDLTRFGRYKGFAAGLIAVLLITGLYYALMRTHIYNYVMSYPNLVYAADILCFVIGIICNLGLVKIIGTTALKYNLSELLKTDIDVNSSQVKAGKIFIWSIIANVGVFLGMSWIALIMGYIKAAPLWTHFLI